MKLIDNGEYTVFLEIKLDLFDVEDNEQEVKQLVVGHLTQLAFDDDLDTLGIKIKKVEPPKAQASPTPTPTPSKGKLIRKTKKKGKKK